MQGGGKTCSKAKLSPAHLNIGSDEIRKRRTEGAHKGCLENPVFKGQGSEGTASQCLGSTGTSGQQMKLVGYLHEGGCSCNG